MQRCYCGQRGGSFAGNTASSILKPMSHNNSSNRNKRHQAQAQQRSDLLSLTSSSRHSIQPTKFIKRPCKPQHNVNLGLGHSNSELSRQFSRRNSAATTLSQCSSCGCTSQHQQQRQQRESRIKVLSWGNGERSNNPKNNNNTSHCELTDNRRFYEQHACSASRRLAQGQGQGQVQSANPAPHSPLPNSRAECNDEMQRLLSLQKFRLLNATDCFSVQRQDELRLQRAYDKLGVANDAKWEKNKANAYRQVTSSSSPMPYALRQKLLQLRLEEELAGGRGTGAVCAPLERSCALRYNCQ